VHNLATDYRHDGQFEINVPLLEDLLEKQRRICGPMHEDTLSTMHRLAMAYDDVGRFADSITLHEHYFDAVNSPKNPNHEPPTWEMMTFARVCQRAGELAGWTRHTFDLPNNAASGTTKVRETEVLWCNF
jgi:hypothetical protein